MASSAVVARTALNETLYLVLSSNKVEWGASLQAAARFQTLRDATREAMRLPSTLRAFALPG